MLSTEGKDGRMHATVLEKDTLSGVSAPKVITSDEQNERYISVLLELERRDHLSTSEKNYAELLTLLIEDYEEKRYPIKSATPIEVLTELMASNNLKQKDLVPIFGAESTVSAVLRGKRALTKKHIERLSKRFHVSPALFF